MKIKLGSIYSTPQFRMHYWRLEKRRTKIKAYLKVKSPSAEQIADKITKSAHLAARLVGVEAIILGGAAALPAFFANARASNSSLLPAAN